jgi:hypothetical protein
MSSLEFMRRKENEVQWPKQELGMTVYERSRKKSQLDTIWYEISMLGFCHSELTNREKMSEPERNLFIEGFLLHYRNLIQFFSGNPGKHRWQSDKVKFADLSTEDPEPWASRKLTPEEISQIQVPGRALEDAYWTDISQFLQHCTERRFVEFWEWRLDEMFEKLNPIVAAFHKSFPPMPEAQRPENVLSMNAASTATFTEGPTLGAWTFKKVE